MKSLIAALFIAGIIGASFEARAEVLAQITHFSGNVLVNGHKIHEKTTLHPRYIIEIADAKEAESFALISFKNGHQMVVKSGQVVVEQLSLDWVELSAQKAQILALVESQDKRYALPAVKINSQHASFEIYGGKISFNASEEKTLLDTAQGKVLVKSAWGTKEVVSEAGIAVDSARFPASDDLSAKRLKWLKMQFRKMSLY